MRIIQILDALDYGDGVSNDAVCIKKLLDELGIENGLYVKWWDERVKQYITEIDKYTCKKDDIIIYHFAGQVHLIDLVVSFKCKKLIKYHNITPPKFFLPDNPKLAVFCETGLKQIRKYIRYFDGALADSRFNADDLIGYGADADTVDVLPIAFDCSNTLSAKPDKLLSRRLSSQKYFLVVGRVVKNKCIEDSIDAFEYYYRFHDSDAYLYIIGNMGLGSSYTELLRKRVSTLRASEHIIFTDKVNDNELTSYYGNARALLCMSEHEGFCIPLLEAASRGVPVIAYSSTAVPYTMGNSGILLYKKDPGLTAHLMYELSESRELAEEIIRKQNLNLEKYSNESIKEQLSAVLRKWGVESNV